MADHTLRHWCAVDVVFSGVLFVALRQMPLFTNVDDLMTSWNRLETEADSEAKSPTIQVGRCVSYIVFIQLASLSSAPMPRHTYHHQERQQQQR